MTKKKIKDMLLIDCTFRQKRTQLEPTDQNSRALSSSNTANSMTLGTSLKPKLAVCEVWINLKKQSSLLTCFLSHVNIEWSYHRNHGPQQSPGTMSQHPWTQLTCMKYMQV